MWKRSTLRQHDGVILTSKFCVSAEITVRLSRHFPIAHTPLLYTYKQVYIQIEVLHPTIITITILNKALLMNLHRKFAENQIK